MTAWKLVPTEPTREMVLKSRRAVKGPLPVQLMTDEDRHPADLKHRIRLRSAIAASPDPAEDVELTDVVAEIIASPFETAEEKAEAVLRLLSGKTT